MNKLPEHFFEDLEEDYEYDFDENFLEIKIEELDDLIKIFEALYFYSDLKKENLLYVIVNKSAKLRKCFQLYLKKYFIQDISCKNT